MQTTELPKLHPVGVNMILRVNDDKIKSLHSNVRDKQLTIEELNKEKEEMGFELYNCYEKINKVHKDIQGL